MICSFQADLYRGRNFYAPNAGVANNGNDRFIPFKGAAARIVKLCMLVYWRGELAGLNGV